MADIRRDIFRGLHTTASVTDSVPDSGTLNRITVMQSPSNPSAASSEGGVDGYTTVYEQAPHIGAELKNKKFVDDETLPARLFSGIGTDADIERVLWPAKIYNRGKKQWTALADPAVKNMKLEKELYPLMVPIVNKILATFALSDTRLCCHSHKKRMSHVETQTPTFVAPAAASDIQPLSNPEETRSVVAAEDDDLILIALPASAIPNYTKVKSSPDLAIVGRFDVKDGDAPHNTESPIHLTKFVRPEYTETITPIEVKKTLDDLQHAPLQVGVYARQIFIQQSNRKAVCCLILTPTHVRLYVFDREGVCHSTAINIHEEPVTFVRIILGVAGHDSHGLVGFDTSIFYKGQTRYLRTMGADLINKTVYTIEPPHGTGKPEPFFRRFAIYGRGTACWLVTAPNGNCYIVKDAWRTNGRDPEWKILQHFQEKTKSTPDKYTGVGHMVAFEDGIALLSDFRKTAGLSQSRREELHEIFTDRILCRITFDVYGSPIEGFYSRESVLCALRDAIKGHQNLWDAQILHRDVSINNILLGLPSAKEGWRGVLIDLDMAIRFDREANSGHFKIGTRTFQSLNVLNHYSSEPNNPSIKPHDYLDDLESFYYTLCWICCGYDGPGKKVYPFPSQLKDWEDGNAYKAAQSKRALMFGKFKMRLTPYFEGEIFFDLLDGLHRIFKDVNYRLANQTREEERRPKPNLKELAKSEAKINYEKVLNLFDGAIKQLAHSPSPPVTPPRCPPPSLGPVSNPGKVRFFWVEESRSGLAQERHSNRSTSSRAAS